ncbi:hypothetical protein M408DRAFT_327441 [Serendipita vermifera MAFF 305830]|uniref:BTB domain-containing protein n=1 Tax=Serendipita vermifera MAFF 305830 TaxID=933852 RepID=A0A0C3B2W2_SERVB|nr:hypothetical protein M408DRAFT_327441 [Serendipita vermifera MAFF 305830]
METPTTRDSTLFPPGYGEVILQSNDGLVCHFPRYLLAYMSTSFRDKFELPIVESQAGNRSEGVYQFQMTVPGQILELFLVYIDPKHSKPPIDLSTIEALLEMAEEHKVPTITEWFIKKAIVEERSNDSTSSVVTGAFAATNVMLALHCSTRFNLPIVGQFALQEFAGCDISRISFTTSIPLWVYQAGMKLREERIRQYENLIEETTKESLRVLCDKCTPTCVRWLLTMQSELRKGPRWEVLERVIGLYPPDCHHVGRMSWKFVCTYTLTSSTLGTQIRAAELRLPTWPDLVKISSRT